MKIQPVLTPDNYEACILPLIRGAKTTFLMQTQYISPPKSAPQPGTPAGQSDDVLEALIAGIAELIREGVDVRLIFSQYETQDKLELLKERGIPQANVRIQTRVHNKGMVVDSSIVVVGSQNWSGEGVTTNRDASLIIHDGDAVAQRALRPLRRVQGNLLDLLEIEPVMHRAQRRDLGGETAEARPRAVGSRGGGPRDRLAVDVPHVLQRETERLEQGGKPVQVGAGSEGHSRGRQVDVDDALDVFAVEPLPAESPLWGLENVIVTPHVSNSSPRVRERSLALVVENVRRFKAGEPLLNVVDKAAGY